MTEISEGNQQQPDKPDPTPRSLGRLVGTWRVSGEAQGKVTYEWMEGDSFLIQRVNLEQFGQPSKGIEIIGRERPFGADEPSEDIKSRYYDNQGNTFDYVYELEGDTLTIWGGQRGSPAYYRAAPRPRPGVHRVAVLAEEDTEMKTIGLLGGMNWESSIEYERLLERGVDTVTEQAAKVDDLVDEASSPASKPRSRAP